MDFQISKLGDNERESIAMNFNNGNAFAHALEINIFSENMSQKLQEISK